MDASASSRRHSRVSVVIPARDAADRVGRAIASAREAGEVVVLDGGSQDGTARVAALAGATVIASPQLAAGAAATHGDWIVFLQADSALEPGFVAALRQLPEDVVGGAFRLAIERRGAGYRLVEAGARLRCRVLNSPHRDQALFARRRAYEAAGGAATDDASFVRALRRQGRLAWLPLRTFRGAPRAAVAHTTAG